MRISFNVRDEKAEECLILFCRSYGYKDTVFSGDELVANPESRQDFATRTLREMFIGPFKRQRAEVAANSAINLADGEL